MCKWNLPSAGSMLSGLIPGKNEKSYKAYNSKILSGRRWEICHLSARSKPLHYTSIFLEITYKNVANPLYQFGKNQIGAMRKVISKPSPQRFATHCIIQPIKSSLKNNFFKSQNFEICKWAEWSLKIVGIGINCRNWTKKLLETI